MWARLIPILLLLVKPTVSRVSPYDIDDIERPDNVTGLDVKYYGNIGSYYNGSLIVRISPQRKAHKVKPLDGNACGEYEDRTFEFIWDALVGLIPTAPNAPSPNPFFLSLYAWDEGYRLPNENEPANYSEYQGTWFHTFSSDQKPIFYFGITNQTDNDRSYYFDGHMSTEFMRQLDIPFNASGICTPTSSKEDLLFKGTYMVPDSEAHLEWMRDLSVPTIRGYFNLGRAYISISGYLRAISEETELVGKAEVVFQGQIDNARSDQLLLGKKRPEWNATLGFSVPAGGDVASVAISTKSWKTELQGLVLLLGLALLP
ncbi:hypothetical protein AFCA_002814 [Aspergillus flavus]|uniref:Uncharacterized protein n=2 Tax=Aspergillus subgen. Circumdati TaxID=2720871 RepID=A0A1S9D6F4_ASPOZ|nr:hypothetical protein OAory_01110190 [Aspergillus oryzae]RAQ65712.1 hypothetical protein COH20_011669 [Aspergillus flavus]UDD55175.1 hypothetical protein AFCA_002814 [Aspergillus flavus]